MSRFNSFLAVLLPLFPRWFAKPFAKPYVAGETVEQAIAVARNLNHRGYAVTLDILGEHIHSREASYQIRDAYRRLYDRIAAEGVRSTISLKLTHLGLEIDPALAEENVLAVLEKAREYNNFLRIDMENSPYTDHTLRIYRRCRDHYPGVGAVLQAYLRRTLADIQNLNSARFNVRICKGIYREDPTLAYQDKQAIRDNFIRAVQTVLEGEGYAAIATHDITIIDTLETWIENHALSTDRFEFQALYGVPIGPRLKRLLAKGYTVRIYVPFGAEWFDYSIRRLKENPHIVGYILKNLFKHKRQGRY